MQYSFSCCCSFSPAFESMVPVLVVLLDLKQHCCYPNFPALIVCFLFPTASLEPMSTSRWITTSAYPYVFVQTVFRPPLPSLAYMLLQHIGNPTASFLFKFSTSPLFGVENQIWTSGINHFTLQYIEFVIAAFLIGQVLRRANVLLKILKLRASRKMLPTQEFVLSIDEIILLYASFLSFPTLTAF